MSLDCWLFSRTTFDVYVASVTKKTNVIFIYAVTDFSKKKNPDRLTNMANIISLVTYYLTAEGQKESPKWPQ